MIKLNNLCKTIISKKLSYNGILNTFNIINSSDYKIDNKKL